MDVIQSIRQYLDKVMKDASLEGMKALLLDEHTTKFVSMVYSQSEILEKEVYLVEELGTAHERMLHMKAAVFIRPTNANIEILKKELKDPKYGEYHLFFSNILDDEMLERLASYDELEIVRQVQEYYGDFLAVNPDLFHLDLQKIGLRAGQTPTKIMSSYAANTFNRTVEGILSVLLSLKKKPVIRYQSGSETNSQLARELSKRMQRDGLFDFRRTDTSPVLLLLDRKEDPVTPLLCQWTYQAMVHEILGLEENRVDLTNAPQIRKDNEKVVLSVISDEFFKKHFTANFGDLGMAVKGLVDEYQAKTKTHESIESIEDMQRFMESYPAFRSQSLNVSKHVALMGELARIVDIQALMDVSQLEQELSTNEEHSTHFKELCERIRSGRIQPLHKLKLAMLYALRYETSSSNQISKIKTMLKDEGISSHHVTKIDDLLAFGGSYMRSGDLYGDRGLKKYMRAMTQGLQGVPNVYAQHVPAFMRSIEAVLKGQLVENEFPFASGSKGVSNVAREKPKDVVVFISGGVTFEEACKIHELNQKLEATNQRVILGGSSLLNSKSFLKELEVGSISQSTRTTSDW